MISLGNYNGKKLEAKPLNFASLIYVKKLKNQNREYFFYNKKISFFRHFKWYYNYRRNIDDTLFILQVDNLKYGTVGIRKISTGFELYSVIRDQKVAYQRKLMQIMVKNLLLNFTESDTIFCKVIRSNTAIEWYLKLGFKKEFTDDQMHLLILRKLGDS